MLCYWLCSGVWRLIDFFCGWLIKFVHISWSLLRLSNTGYYVTRGDFGVLIPLFSKISSIYYEFLRKKYNPTPPKFYIPYKKFQTPIPRKISGYTPDRKISILSTILNPKTLRSGLLKHKEWLHLYFYYFSSSTKKK